MENDDNLVFFDSVEAEENFLQGKSSTPTSTRRLSASSRASTLKTKNLIPPLHTPTDRRISLPRATKTPQGNAMPASDKRKPPAREGGQLDDSQGKAAELSASEKFIAEQLKRL